MKAIDNQLIKELHPLPPFLPENARVLMLGSFPPPRVRWVMDFYYPNLQNDMWCIFGIVFFKSKEYFLAEDKKSYNEQRIRLFLKQKGIALSDTAREVVRQRGNASDQFLQIVKTIPLKEVLEQLPHCCAIVTTGQKATDTLVEIIGIEPPKVGTFMEFTYAGRSLRLYRMPSSSRAYPKPLQAKAEVYQQMFEEMGMCFTDSSASEHRNNS